MGPPTLPSAPEAAGDCNAVSVRTRTKVQGSSPPSSLSVCPATTDSGG